MFKNWLLDVRAVLERDPAARSWLEVVLCYPGYKALRRHRWAHFLYRHGHYLWARMVSNRTRRITGIDIHPGATIGRAVFIDHGLGVVIGETAVIGDYVTLYQGSTLGGTGKDTGKRHPTVEDHVVIGAGAKVLGPFTVGAHSKIGAGAVVLKEVPPYCTVVGNPGQIVRHKGRVVPRNEVDLEHTQLPDPVHEQLAALQRRVELLERGGRSVHIED
nr:serine O-acetyltransferase EpsC [Maliibacterium massiliense]